MVDSGAVMVVVTTTGMGGRRLEDGVGSEVDITSALYLHILCNYTYIYIYTLSNYISLLSMGFVFSKESKEYAAILYSNYATGMFYTKTKEGMSACDGDKSV